MAAAIPVTFLCPPLGLAMMAWAAHDTFNSAQSHGVEGALIGSDRVEGAKRHGFTGLAYGNEVSTRAKTRAALADTAGVTGFEGYLTRTVLFGADLAMTGGVAEAWHGVDSASLAKLSTGDRIWRGATSGLAMTAELAPALMGAARALPGLARSAGSAWRSLGNVLKASTRSRGAIHASRRGSVLNPFGPAPKSTKPQLGAYRDTGGHHPHAQAAFRGGNYNPNEAFAISREFMDKVGIDHRLMNRAQQDLFGGLAKASTGTNSWRLQNEIAVEVLVRGGADPRLARWLTAQSLRSLRAQGVRNPTRIPWEPR
jgi:hypothetical protein